MTTSWQFQLNLCTKLTETLRQIKTTFRINLILPAAMPMAILLPCAMHNAQNQHPSKMQAYSNALRRVSERRGGVGKRRRLLSLLAVLVASSCGSVNAQDDRDDPKSAATDHIVDNHRCACAWLYVKNLSILMT